MRLWYICNTLFTKRNIQKQTWQHPKSNQWHCIDFAMMDLQKDRQRCLNNTTVMRSAECKTDHQLLRVCVRFECKAYRSPQPPRGKRFDVVIRRRRHP